jgi:DNA-binding CsgD family transcriptional regulator
MKGTRLEIKKLVDDGMSLDDISKKLGITRSTISYHLKNLNYGRMNKTSDGKIKQIEELYYHSKMTLKEISEKLEVSKTTIKKYIIPSRNNQLTDEERKCINKKKVVSWRVKVKEKLVKYKGGCCEKCGYNKCINALEFHHTNPNQKEFAISGKSYSFERLKSEVDKCMLVCSNCHKEIHEEIRVNG